MAHGGRAVIQRRARWSCGDTRRDFGGIDDSGDRSDAVMSSAAPIRGCDSDDDDDGKDTVMTSQW